MLAAASETARAQPPAPPPFLGLSVQEVLEYYRQQGYPFAYSSNLVGHDLRVLTEPTANDPLAVVAQILRPHGLEVRQQEGMLLVVRSARAPPGATAGSLLIFVRGPDSRLFEPPVTISASHGFAAVEALGAGVWQVQGLPVGPVHIDVLAPGFQPLRREALITAAAPATLHLRLDPAPLELETLTVSTSRYVLFSNSQFYVDQRAIQSLPGNGEDPLRAAHRLPGAAAGGWSAQTHFRGGEENETAIFLNGQRLLDPFHVRDYHNIFSSIDARSIAGVEAWTGGFPAAYGDRMSGILLLQSRQPDRPRRHELGLSVFNTSLLSSGLDAEGRFDWLVSARRSNLPAVLDRAKTGKPEYHDLFATLGYNPSALTRLTFNLLHARDRILAITEHLADDREESRSDTRNAQGWIQLEHEWPGGLSLSAVLSHARFSNQREALVYDPEQLVGNVSDDRDVHASSLRLDFRHAGSGRHLWSWGFEALDTDARYRYRSEAEYRGFYLAFPGIEENLRRSIDAAPSGTAWSLYVSDRWQLRPSLAIDAGLRWDRQTWVPDNDSQFSPRLSLLYTPVAGTDLRLTWGRYYQSQQIQQLQVEDGVDHFFPAQRADHLIAGLSRRIGPRWALRVEAFEKRYDRLRPRFESLLDPVPLIGELEPDRVRVAPDGARARGAEFTAEYDSDAWTGWASWTVARVTDRIDGRNQPRNWDQRHALQAGVAWRSGPWELGAAIKAHSGWPTTSASLAFDGDDEPVLVPGPRNAEHLNTFINVDLRVTRRWQFERSLLTAYFELNNALDRKNECCVDYDLEDEDESILERSVDHWLGIAPAVGLLWEF